MNLSAPIYHLKRQAKALSRDEKIPLHEALDRVAAREGFSSWSLLAAQYASVAPSGKLYAQLRPGDLLLVAARPGHGKTLLSLELAVEAMRAGHKSVFFSLEYTENECHESFRAIGADASQFAGQFQFDGSDAIDADHMMDHLDTAPRGTFVLVDYLQLLDQKRESPELMVQVRALREFAIRRGLTMAFISQVDRSFDPASKPVPDLEDIRLPNPLDLTLFDKVCFLNDGAVRFRAAS